MTWDQNISQGELRASAGAVDTLVTDLRPILTKALADLTDAGTSFAPWSAGAKMTGASKGWGSALQTLQQTLADHAEGLRGLANGTDVMEQEILSKFRGW
ncbi:hypothetical protein ACFWFZ_13650 [Streptomyces sp. NPDC060232]|uniref:hypothetical protein n=1 Tax=Streptomyces sp. NPDC060232 TaxID=3347079 RepID=UPI0036511BE1